MKRIAEEDLNKLAISKGYLYDWYQSSVSELDNPVWTDEHIEEVFNDFYLIPKNY